MKFLFHTVSLGKTGGARVIMNLSEALINRGHSVEIVIDRNKVDYIIPQGVVIRKLTAFGLKRVDGLRSTYAEGVDLRRLESKLKARISILSYGFKWFKYLLKLMFVFPLKFFFIKRYLRQYKPDLIASHNMYQDHEHLYFYRNKNFYLVIHNSPNEVYLDRVHFKLLPFSWYLKGVRVVCVSLESEAEFKSLFSGSGQTIYNPIDIGAIRDLSKEELEPAYQDLKYILVVASLGERKRVDRAIKLLADLNNQDLVLLVLGDGPLKDDLQNYSKVLGVADKVMFAGFKSNPYKYMKNAEVLVLTADSEGLGMVLVESLATGTIVVSLDCPVGPREVLGGAMKRYLVPMRGRTELEIQSELMICVKKALCRVESDLIIEECLRPFDTDFIASQWEDLASLGSLK